MANQLERQREKDKARAARRARYETALAKGDAAGKSKYAQKIARKLGGGTVDYRWMWWRERAA